MTQERTLHRVGTEEVRQWVIKETRGYESGLEFGCGYGAYTRHILCPVKAGIDAFEPYITEARTMPENEGVEFICGDMRRFERYATRDYALALFVDSLEHLTKTDAFDLIDKCKQSFSKIALFLPIGDFTQDPCDGNEMQRHLSIWDENDLEAMQLSFWIKTDFHRDNPTDRQAAAFATWVSR